MLESEFERFLLDDKGITSKEKAVATRMSKARAIEETLKTSLDTVVSSDTAMYHALLEVNSKMKNQNGAYSNALRKYYIFKNNKAFPQINAFERINDL